METNSFGGKLSCHFDRIQQTRWQVIICEGHSLLYSLHVCFKDLFTASLLFSCHWSNVHYIYKAGSRWRQGAEFESYHLVWLASVHLVSPWGCCKESESCHICHGKADIILSRLCFYVLYLALVFLFKHVLYLDFWRLKTKQMPSKVCE